MQVIIAEMTDSTEVKRLPAHQGLTKKNNRRTRPVEELKLVISHLMAKKNETTKLGGKPVKTADGAWLKERPELEKAIVAALELKRPERTKKKKKAAAMVKMNLHRLNQLLWYCLFRWDGKGRWRGGDMRSQVVDLCKQHFGAQLSDDEALGRACDHSGEFAGLFKLMDVEIRLAVEPFALWEQGDFRSFARAMPSMCAYIAGGHKPQVSKVVLMALERMDLYIEKHPHLVKHIGLNCTLFDEEKIEFLNAKIGRWFSTRTPNAGIEAYTKVTSMMKGVEAIQRTFDELLIRKKAQSTEGERLRTAYLSPAWDDTHVAFDSFLLKKFTSALDGTWDTGAWPRADRFAAGMANIDSKTLPDLLRWARDQRALRGTPQGGGAGGGGGGGDGAD